LAYRESPFRGTPLVELQQGSTTVYTCPLKDVLFWRTTSGLYYDVVENERARHIVGSKFEEFERDLIAAKFPVAGVRGEVPYGPKGLNKKTPDITVWTGGELAIAFECKAKRLPLSEQFSSDATSSSQAISELAKGVLQLVRFHADITSGAYPSLGTVSPNAEFVVLTLDDWMFIGETARTDVMQAASVLIAKAGIQPKLDLRQIGFCTAAELDIMVTKLDLAELQSVFEACRGPARYGYSPWTVSSELFPRTNKWRDYPLADRLNAILPERLSRAGLSAQD
jgi:hypothetical protein